MAGTYELIIILLIVFTALIVGAITAGILFLREISKLLQKCSPENRTLQPAEVWLALIPLFNFYWQFVIVNSVSDSLQKEFRKRAIIEEELPGKKIGMATCILFIALHVPYANLPVGPAWLICFIIYWTKLRRFSQKLGPFPSKP